MEELNDSGFYKGYVPGKNSKGKEKEAMVAYTKEENLLTLEQCRPYDNILGVLDHQSTLLDADEELHSTNLMEIIQGEELHCMVTTREGGRGIHALFINNDIKTNATAVMLACGVVVDIKLGCRNGLESLRYQGVERFQNYNEPPYQTIPKYMFPLKNCKVNFSSMGEGDGRNQALFNYILTLQSNDFSEDEIRQTIRIINKYVLSEPLSDDEIEIILRDDAFKKQSFFKGTSFLHDKFAEYIKRTHHIKKINGQLHIFEDGVYVPGYEEIEAVMLKEIRSLTDAKRKEVLKYLTVTCEKCSQSDVNLIAFRNGIYDLYTDKLLPFSPDVIITNKIPWDYNPNAYDELADKTLNKIACDDSDIRSLLEEMVGCCFYRSNELAGGKAFILTGEKSNGKSTLLEVLKKVLGKDNISVLDLKNLDDRFSTVMMFGKLANIGDDISDEYKMDVSVFKKVVTGNSISAEQKGQPKFDFEPYVKLIFSANNIPHMKDSTGAAQRRLLIIPFNAQFTNDDPDYDPHIVSKLKGQESMEYLIQIGIQGLKRVLENRKFTTSVKVQSELDDYEKENNPVLSFIEEVGIDAIENEPTNEVYRLYTVYCAENNYKSASKTSFSRQLKSNFGLIAVPKTLNSKTVRVYEQR